ncbi:unnamed protein product [marine sediment metagenome]|uniref:Uncharacterized protein n=1 Tax=marine sediment metagenome TaxID=412755 RepID=X0S4M0_9ZZZZ
MDDRTIVTIVIISIAEEAKEEAAERAGDYAYHCAKLIEQQEILYEIEYGG